ncbi:hypothetical protein [Teredinibacter haidensis]|uniref:hypothetical protein n=1 Tax=Teredinibacter haidensis TaxID=2731755 RepID=UPI00111547EE|nr:hypothetical protein [Teredinibacter haidensis]
MEQKYITSTEMGLLPKLISIPSDVVSVKWRAPDDGASGSKNLLVLIRFSNNDYEKVLGDSEPLGNAKTRFPKALFDEWVPQELKNNMQVQQQGDIYLLETVQPYQPSVFTRTDLSPFVNGTLYPLGDGYMLLDLTSM